MLTMYGLPAEVHVVFDEMCEVTYVGPAAVAGTAGIRQSKTAANATTTHRRTMASPSWRRPSNTQRVITHGQHWTLSYSKRRRPPPVERANGAASLDM